MLYATLGIPLFFVVLANLGRLLTRGIKFLWSRVRRLYYTQTFRRMRKTLAKLCCLLHSHIDCHKNNTTTTNQLQHVTPDDAADDDVSSYVEFEVDDLFNLHPLVAILVTTVYIFFGALMYVQWESWTYLEAFYFIFVSVSTIGFGDLVPEHPRYFLLSSVYILLGLSLVAMVINVIMEFFSNTMTKASQKVDNLQQKQQQDPPLKNSRSGKTQPLQQLGDVTDFATILVRAEQVRPSGEFNGEVNPAFESNDLTSDMYEESTFPEETSDSAHCSDVNEDTDTYNDVTSSFQDEKNSDDVISVLIEDAHDDVMDSVGDDVVTCDDGSDVYGGEKWRTHTTHVFAETISPNDLQELHSETSSKHLP